MSARRTPKPLWHADGDGRRCRGHQFADLRGRFAFHTVVPGVYAGRTRHFHVRVQAPGGPVLTAQLFFPGEPRNADDWLFREELLLAVVDASAGRTARFDFVIDPG